MVVLDNVDNVMLKVRKMLSTLSQNHVLVFGNTGSQNTKRLEAVRFQLDKNVTISQKLSGSITNQTLFFLYTVSAKVFGWMVETSKISKLFSLRNIKEVEQLCRVVSFYGRIFPKFIFIKGEPDIWIAKTRCNIQMYDEYSKCVWVIDERSSIQALGRAMLLSERNQCDNRCFRKSNCRSIVTTRSSGGICVKEFAII